MFLMPAMGTNSATIGGGFAGFPFTAPTLPGGATLTRASSGTRVNSSGVLVTETTDVARFTYDPTTLALEGLLVEPARTNLVLQSNTFSNAAWDKTNNPTFTPGAATSPDGTADGWNLAESVGAGFKGVFQGVTVVNGSTYATSAFLKAATRTWAYFDPIGATDFFSYLNLATGALGTVPGGGTATVKNYANSWWRLGIGRAIDSTSLSAVISPTTGNGVTNYTGDGSGMLIFGAQVELASDGKPSSYIVTTAAAATRAADVLSLTIPTGTYNIDITRLSGLTQLTGVSVVGNSYTVPTDVSPLQSVYATRTA